MKNNDLRCSFELFSRLNKPFSCSFQISILLVLELPPSEIIKLDTSYNHANLEIMYDRSQINSFSLTIFLTTSAFLIIHINEANVL